MRPHVVAHNTVSLDGAIEGFPIDVGLHYRIAGALEADLHLAGSETMLAGTGNGTLPAETESDFRPPDPSKRPEAVPWAVPDSTARLMGTLHVTRRFEYCRDIVVFVSTGTPDAYLDYLRARRYPHHVVGEGRVDLDAMLRILGATYGARRALLDSGGTLLAALLERGLVDELSLVMAPHLAGPTPRRLFRGIGARVPLTLEHVQRQPGDVVHMRHLVGIADGTSTVAKP